MPKLGMEPIRRAALVKATIAEVGDAGSLDVSVSKIAKRAGMSSALAHHYFGGKDQIFVAAMRQILRDFGAQVVTALKAQPGNRAGAIVDACFADECFAPATISAWMTFYVQAQTNPDALRLLQLYQRRLRSNLTHALRGSAADPQEAADMLAALIDGFYIRAALAKPEANARAKVLKMLDILTHGAA
ncbi:transcriptional regulator BetI [Yoonia sp. R2331]|uniref:choline-binding transcriptional repressor BetI n=1 Tax=Yoonia sp. R2331 TaxID=3237238 RepID=UPI0034E3D742